MNKNYDVLLRVYIAGMTPAAVRAIDNLKRICDDCFGEGRYDMPVIDIKDNPDLAETAKILATPTVIKELPAPLQRIIGDLSDESQVIAALELVKPQ